ncbi:SOS response-associated peptidase [Mucilaginibacter terrae]|uniref:SOS response-associated peptidase n=1 Tax=Mucilaginibacter terrae TaxID=1955052 RepID=UPI003630FFB3
MPIVTPVSGFKGGATTPEEKDDIRPTDLSPVITHHRPREIQYMRWGLIPGFVNDPKEIKPMLNARAETLTTTRSFKDLIMATRCLILNEGFYETEKSATEQIEWKITPATEDYFYKAGLWTTWRNPVNGEIIECFTMITCDPTGHSFRDIHDRMPIIMNKAQRRLWMNPNASLEQLMALLTPCEADVYIVTENKRTPLKAKRIKKDDKDFLF